MSILRRLRDLPSLSILLAASSVIAFGQTDTGTLLGSVVDPTQSVVPEAKVTLRNTQTGATLTATTDKDGVFQFPGVLVGSYSVQVTATGFKAYELSGILLSSAETRNLGRLRMEIGGVAEQVKVTAQATPVQTSSSEINHTVEQAKLEELSAKGRDPFQFFDLMPGVVDTSTSRDNPTYNMLQGLNINGLSGISNVSHMLDGVHHFDMALDKTVVVRERLRFRIRWQAYNVFNHAEFNAYGATYTFNAANVNTSTTTGQYTGTLNPRQQELSIRAVF